VEVWGGNLIESSMRHLDESPWERLRKCSQILEGNTLLGGVSRGRNLFGYSPYPNYVLENFYKEAVKNGLNVMRLFDALNDIENLRDSVVMLNEYGAIPDVALCYTIDPLEEKKPEVKKSFFSRLFGGFFFGRDEETVTTEKIFTDDYFVNKAKEIEACGARIFTLKDMAGLITPSRLYSLMPKLKHAIKIPVDFHTHCNAGYGLASTLTAILKGVDIVDTAIWWFAGGGSAPAIELVWIFCKKLDIDSAVDMQAVGKIRAELLEARKDLADFDRNRDQLPYNFEELYQNMPPEIDAEFDRAIQAASDDRETELLDACRKIEEYFGFPKPDKRVSNPDMPYGMYSDITSELWNR
ncbi:MAG: carboxylase, partial [Muribaculaceae bacterium]|nr:carboxylase [Muribaculaceae bacterium]